MCRAAPPATTQSSSGGMLSGIGSTIAQRMAFGTGSAIAHRAVGAVAGSLSGSGNGNDDVVVEEKQMAPANNPCEVDQRAFVACLDTNGNDLSQCQMYYDGLKACQQASTF